MRNRSNPRSLSPHHPLRPTRPRGAARHIAAHVVAAGAVVWAGIASVTSPTSSTSPTSKMPTTKRTRMLVPPIEVEASLGELGLTPRVLAAAGFSAPQTTSFATAAAGYMRDHITDYRSAQDAVYQARTEVNRLQRLVQGGGSTQDDRTAFDTAQTTLTTAIAQRQAILDAAMAAGAAEVSPQAVTLLNTFRTNQRLWWLPEEYLGDSRSQGDWVQLRDALANDRISARDGVDPDPTLHQFLLDAQGAPNAANAFTNMINLPDIQTAWNTAMGQ